MMNRPVKRSATRARQALAVVIILVLGYAGYIGLSLVATRGEGQATKEQVAANCRTTNRVKRVVADTILELAKALGPGDTVTPQERSLYEERFAPRLKPKECPTP